MSLNRNPTSPLQEQLDDLSLQTIDSLPDELLLPIFGTLSPFKRALLLQICKKWNQVILHHIPFWQHLHLSENFSPSEIVKILSIFNERSGCRLKQVVLETKITSVKHLNRIFVQLKRSGRSLHVLALHQDWKLNGKTRVIAMQHFPMLDSLLTVPNLEFVQSLVLHMFEHRASLGIQNRSNDESGLRFFTTEALLKLTQEDLRWLSKLKYLSVNTTESIMSMRRILETTENLVELDLTTWTTLGEASSSDLRDLYLNSKPVHLQALKSLACPINLPITLALSQVLEIDGDQTLLSGRADSLVLWKVIGLKAAFLHLSPYSRRDDMEILVEKAKKFFQLNPTIQSLTLRCLKGGYGGDQYHINRLLEMLDTSSLPQEPGTRTEGEGASSSSNENLTLPHLEKLTIKDATTLDGNLLQKIFRYRRQRNDLFRLEFTEGLLSETVVVEDWKARGWMN